MCEVDVAVIKMSNYAMEIRNKKWWMPCFLFYNNFVLSNVQVVCNLLTKDFIFGKALRMEFSKQLIGNNRFGVVSTTVYTPNNEDMLDEDVDGCYDDDQHHDNAQQVNRAMRLERRNR